jgi:surfactin synthase thioesterase subunit
MDDGVATAVIDDARCSVPAWLAELDDRPTTSFGHGMGAILAFEAAWRIEGAGVRRGPIALIASGRRAALGVQPV